MHRIIFRPTTETFGSPDPPIPQGAILILVQDGAATICRYEAPAPPENPWPAFDHPINDQELAAEVLTRCWPSIPGWICTGRA